MSDEQQRGGDSEEASQGEDQRGVHDRWTQGPDVSTKAQESPLPGGQDDDAEILRERQRLAQLLVYCTVLMWSPISSTRLSTV